MPPFRRKPESPRRRREISRRRPTFYSRESKGKRPSHSCEGRNLHAEGGNCTISHRYAAAEIPAFAGMGRVERRESREWRNSAGGGEFGNGRRKIGRWSEKKAKKSGTFRKFRVIMAGRSVRRGAANAGILSAKGELGMKKVILSFRAAFKAVVRALNNVFVPVLNLRGGGGRNIKMRRLAALFGG